MPCRAFCRLVSLAFTAGVHTARANPSDVVASIFREPQRSVGSHRDTERLAVPGGGSEFGDDAGRRNPHDLTAVFVFGEPQSPIRAARNRPRKGKTHRERELGDHASSRHPSDRIGLRRTIVVC